MFIDGLLVESSFRSVMKTTQSFAPKGALVIESVGFYKHLAPIGAKTNWCTPPASLFLQMKRRMLSD